MKCLLFCPLLWRINCLFATEILLRRNVQRVSSRSANQIQTRYVSSSGSNFSKLLCPNDGMCYCSRWSFLPPSLPFTPLFSPIVFFFFL